MGNNERKKFSNSRNRDLLATNEDNFAGNVCLGFSWQGADIKLAEVHVLSVEDPDHVWLRMKEDRTHFLQLDQDIQEYCRHVPIAFIELMASGFSFRKNWMSSSFYDAFFCFLPILTYDRTSR